ncbi:hypothetical protein ACJ70E_15780 [Pseudomonas plecoglossicida]|uniref:hypothetical protein n=1 Tax=Pseudomonas plecoglossicida TaxID=70775 RepID=UPI0039773EF5
MKIRVRCFNCRDATDKNQALEEYEIPIQEIQKYELQCNYEHSTTILLRQAKFELLYEIAAHAIADGYYREAVTSFAASLERFYEFFIRTYLRENKTTEEVISKLWSDMASQSERQRGAFTMAYALSTNDEPAVLRSVKFRNDVTHKGEIPTRENAIKFGQEVAEIISSTIKKMKEVFPESWWIEYMCQNKDISKFMKDENTHQESIASMLDPQTQEIGKQTPSLESWVNEILESKESRRYEEQRELCDSCRGSH